MRIRVAFIVVAIVLASYFAVTGPFLSYAPRVHVRDGLSTNWSGYAVETSLASPQSGAVTDVQGKWTVRAVDCVSTPSAYASFWVGIDGYSSGTVEQTGTDSDCSNGVPTYYAWYEMYPKFPVNLNLVISPGDVMFAEVKYLGSGSFQLTIRDTTTGVSFQTTQKLMRAQRSSAEWIAEAPSSLSGVLPLANFGTVYFTNAQATLNGHTGTISDSAWQYDAITMTYSLTGPIKAQPSALSNGGSSFSVTWYHA